MLIRALVIWPITFGIYLFLAGAADAVELVAGLVCASVATGSALALHAVGELHFRLRPPLRALLSPAAALFTETVIVGGSLLRALVGVPEAGKLQRQPFEHGGDEPAQAGRRAIVVLGLSLAPRSFVVREEDDALLVHALPPRQACADPRWPT